MNGKVNTQMSKLRIGRHLKEVFVNLFRNSLMTLITLMSVMITLTIVGVFTIILINVNNITEDIEKNVEAVVYLDVEADEEEISSLREEVKEIEEVEAVDYVNKDQGLVNLIEDLGKEGEAFESLKEDNPLSDTFIVRTFDPQDTKKVALEIAEKDLVLKVDYGEDIIKVLFKITDNVRKIGWVLIIGLSVTALLLIANTIKMTIEMRKEEIKIMKLVGSSDLFIRLPFIIEGMVLGLIGSVVPVGIMYVLYEKAFVEYSNSVVVQFAELLPVNYVMLPVTLLLIGISVIIGVLGSLISVRRYLKI